MKLTRLIKLRVEYAEGKGAPIQKDIVVSSDTRHDDLYTAALNALARQHNVTVPVNFRAVKFLGR